MADEFVLFMVGGLAIIGILFVVFGFGFSGIGYATQQSGFDNYFVTSPVIVGKVPVDAVETLTASFTADNYLRTNIYDLGDRRVSNGLLFGDAPVRVNITGSEFTTISFDVTKTNGYGGLIIKVDGTTVEQQHLQEGHYEFDLGPGHSVEIASESSEWKVWAPSVYELSSLRIAASTYPREKTTYTFETNTADVQSMRMDFYMTSNAGQLLVKMNGDVVYSGAINNEQNIYLDSSKLDTINILSFEAEKDSKFEGRTTIAITHRSVENKNFVADINMSGDDYSRFTAGTISFDVRDVYTPGGYSVSIVNAGQLLMKEYAKLEKGYFVVNVDRKTMRQGLNEFIVTPVDGATFTIQSFNTHL